MKKEKDNLNSYKSAEIDIPEKLILNRKALKMLAENKLKPVHLQLFPTNKCNLNCSFCSCDDRNKKDELDIEEIKAFINKNISTIQSVTVSGGGEPLMYPHINELFDFLTEKEIKIGLVSNGLLMDRYTPDLFDKCTWIRLSLSEASHDNKVFDVIEKYIKNVKTDWAFSYVAGKDTDKDVTTILKFYNDFFNEITHFRVVGDINNTDDRVKKIEEYFIRNNIDCSKLIFQSRTSFTKGAKKCYLAMIKPVIAANGNIYPCCGVQYAIKNSKKDLNDMLKMGHIYDTKTVFNKEYFDTYGVCSKCYYDVYNKFIDIFFKKNTKHKQFI